MVESQLKSQYGDLQIYSDPQASSEIPLGILLFLNIIKLLPQNSHTHAINHSLQLIRNLNQEYTVVIESKTFPDVISYYHR